MQALHRTILQVMPKCKFWFLDGKDDKGKTVSNPNIGYEFQPMKYADGNKIGKASVTVYGIKFKSLKF